MGVRRLQNLASIPEENINSGTSTTNTNANSGTSTTNTNTYGNGYQDGGEASLDTREKYQYTITDTNKDTNTEKLALISEKKRNRNTDLVETRGRQMR